MIVLPYASVIYTDVGCFSTFADGASYAAYPHDTHHYHVIAHRCGYGDDILAYAREHEVCHHLVGEHFYGRVSPILWALAHGRDISSQEAALEEAMTMTLQRFVRANERPIIGGVDWNEIRRQFFAAVDQRG